MTPWHIWTDGSCQHVGSGAGSTGATPRGGRGFGGWAAILEHGHDGQVVRGRAFNTTNSQMELVAAIEGFRAVPDGSRAILHTDASNVCLAHQAWRLGALPRRIGPDTVLSLELEAEMERVGAVEVVVVGKGARDPIHRRAHVIAGGEAKGAMRGLPPNSIPLDELGGGYRIRQGMRRVARGAATVQTSRRASESQRSY